MGFSPTSNPEHLCIVPAKSITFYSTFTINDYYGITYPTIRGSGYLVYPELERKDSKLSVEIDNETFGDQRCNLTIHRERECTIIHRDEEFVFPVGGRIKRSRVLEFVSIRFDVDTGKMREWKLCSLYRNLFLSTRLRGNNRFCTCFKRILWRISVPTTAQTCVFV